jgi:hypothetical protein
VIRRNSDISAHSSAGDARVLPQGVVSSTVWYQPAVESMTRSESIHAAYF